MPRRAIRELWLQRAEKFLICFIIFIFGLALTETAVFAFSHIGEGQGFSYIFSSLVSMGVSGLGIIFLLLAKLRRIEYAAQEKKQMTALLLSRMAAMEAAMDGIAVTDAKGRITYANRALAELNGYAKGEDLIGNTWTVLYSKEEQRRFEDVIFVELLKKWRWRGPSMGKRKDGETYHQDLSMTALENGGMVWVIRDNSKLMEYLNLAENRLAAIEVAGDGIGIIDAAGRLTYMNKALITLHGIEPADAGRYLGCPWENLYSDKGKADIRDHVLPALKRNGFWRGEAPIVRKDGAIITAELSLSLLADGGFIGTARDTSERKKAEREREELQAQFFQAQKMEAVGRLAGGIAHDFNNILASMMGYSEFLLEDLDDSGQPHYFASQIMNGCLHAQQLVDQILSFSRRGENVSTIIDVVETVRGTEAILRPTVPAEISLNMTLVATEALVQANAAQISQAVMNLCVNAIDAMEGSRGVLSIEVDVLQGAYAEFPAILTDDVPGDDATPPIRISDETEGAVLLLGHIARGHGYVRITVTDTGTGIPRDIMEQIFDPFFTTKPVDRGTGLGLSSIHGIVAAHGGAMIVSTRPGRGTAFSLFLPEAQPYEDMAADDADGEESGELLAGAVLVVEDDPQVRGILENMLGRLDIEAVMSGSPLEAVDMLREHPGKFRLVITDYNMPQMTGVELAQDLYSDFPDLPILMISGYSPRRLQQMAELSPNIKSVLRKPLRRSELLLQMRAAL